MDLLLVNTPIHDYGTYPRSDTSYSTPLGLFYIHASVVSQGYSCEILDAEAAKLSIEDIIREINRAQPRFVGLNAFSVNYGFLEHISAGLPSCTKMILGGPHATLSSVMHITTRLSFTDFVIRGSGERCVTLILKGVEGANLPENVYFRGADGVMHQGRGELKVSNLRLEELSLPSRRVTPFEPYQRDGLLWADIMVSKGCVYKCAFCSGSSHSSGMPYIQRGVESTLQELRFLSKEYAVKGVEIVDDLPFRNRRELFQFFEAIENAGLDFQWEFNLPITVAKTLKQSELHSLRKHGVSRIAFGVESGDEVIRKRVGKNATDAEIISLCQMLRASGIIHKIYLIVGFPGEKKPETLSTIELASRICEDIGRNNLSRPRIFIFKPFPGSYYWRELLEQYTEDELLKYGDYSLENSYFNKHAWSTSIQMCETSTDELIGLINDFYNVFGLSPQ